MAEYTINQDLANPISRLDGETAPADGNLYVLYRQIGSQEFSYQRSYAEIVEQIVSDISARFMFKSMAFRDCSDFARSDHLHGYSHVSCYPVYRENTGQSCIMTLDIDEGFGKNRLSVFSPSLPPTQPPREPAIGEVRFLANSELSAEYITPTGRVKNPNKTICDAIDNGSFDGWVYPDGSEYEKYQGKYDFSKAYSVYGGTDGKFSVPVLSNFFSLNPCLYDFNALRHMPAQLGISSHSHVLGGSVDPAQFSITGHVNMKQKMYAGNNRNYQFLQSATNPSSTITQLTCNNINFNYNAGTAVIYYDGVPGAETHPDYRLVPVQIYIGSTLRK